MSTAFVLWLEKLFANNSTDVVIAKLSAMGWEYLTGGSYKAVYHKKGVPYLIKIAHSDCSNKEVQNYEDRNALDEFTMPNMVRTLPYLAYGRANVIGWGGEYQSAWGIQEKCKSILHHFINRWQYSRIEAIKKMFYSNPDGHTNNIGLTHCGRWVQFD